MNTTQNRQAVKLGGELYTLHRGEMFDTDGKLLPLRAKSARLMKMLLGEPGRIFSKDEIAREVWPDVTASDESISQCVTEIRRALNDSEHVIVKTFPKRGYSIGAEYPKAHKHREVKVLPLVIVALALIAIAVTVVLELTEPVENQNKLPSTAEPLRERVAVLPFQSLNDAGEDDYLTVGLAEDLIIKLSELPGVSVLPSAHSFAWPNRMDDPIELASKLDTRYLVFGRIHHGENRLQVSVQLIDGLNGTNAWAGKYDVLRDDLLTYQQAVLGGLIEAMSVVLSKRGELMIEQPKTSSKQAFEEILKGRVAANEFTKQANLLAEKHFRKAVSLDPNYARAYAELAAVYAIRFENAWAVMVEADEEKALYFAQKAIELDPELWLAHYAIGRIYSITGKRNLEAAEKHLRIAMSLKPDNDDARIFLAVVKIFEKKADEALAIIDTVLATHPAPPHWYFLGRGHALVHLDRYEEAAIALEKCLDQMPTSPYCLRFQIANNGLMGDLEEAKWAASEYTLLGHKLEADLMVSLMLDIHPDYTKRLRQGFRAAGIK